MIDNRKIYSITKYIQETNKKQNDSFILFNEWSRKTGIKIFDFNEAMWFVEYITALLQMDDDILREAQNIDKKEIERLGVSNGST